MSTEGIKQLAQCEEQARERINEAKNNFREVKKQAIKDAENVVSVLKVKNQQKLKELEKQVEEYLELFERTEKEKFEMKIKDLENSKNEENLIEEIIKKICEK
ncbi:hypothetical protein NBO_58g0016 [Nosema bombycis CQ1]|jgi:septation ring formation regulator EzrA|uniref:Uncharacterized protein n=1 Tax=Nosema bombycis (strain CQ1 / CVCC 102059) TaxID=578461 RepID=R0KUB4_NOSB1|nr:hypothetical protein NBO_58g0013 [Nosema bombycis CQ1]EOB13812.1 hypothetical protein NBO_58g0016 [Nosema bombycis CQ1]|eukprot:EOB13809.1 hypothetical protein NBO_58g0013 [Nosema bombycis CQ1]